MGFWANTFEVAVDVIVDVAGSGPMSWIRARWSLSLSLSLSLSCQRFL